jgi:DNA ligase 1
MNPWKVIKSLEGDNSRLGKEGILERQCRAKNDILFYGIRYALDGMMTFGVKQIPEKKGSDGPGLTWAEFVDLLNSLINRKVTGNAAKEQILTAMNQATTEEWNFWYRRILIKDLRCGVSEKTVNKVVNNCGGSEKYSVPVFTCQLAQDSNDQQSKLVGRKQIEVKLDGVRVLTFVYPNGNVIQFSRNGKELGNFPNIREQFTTISKTLSDAWVFDGEIMSAAFQDLMKQLNRKENVQTDDAVLHLFDMIPMADFLAGKCLEDQETRTQALSIWYDLVQDNTPNVKILTSEIVNFDTVAGRDRVREINQMAIDGGYEGIMIKDLNSPYECKRSSCWLKLKPVISFDLTVIGLEEGTGKNAGSLGALVCEGEHNGKNISVNVGTGLSDDERAGIWADKNKIIGQIAEVFADAVTQNQDGSYSLRFPRFSRWRGFDVGEKL